MSEYTHTINLRKSEPFTSFEECLKDFLEKMREMIQEGTSFQQVESACWVERNGNYYGDFYQMRDTGYELGILK